MIWSKLAVLTTVAFCVWSGLSSMAFFDWPVVFAFLIWICPLFLRKVHFSTYPQIIALLFLLFGELGELNFFKQIGMAISLAGLIPWKTKNFFWILGALSWMPALAWVASHLDFSLTLSRLSLSLLSLIFSLPQKSKAHI